MSGIYKITNTIDDRIYIGSAVNFRYRWKKHLKDLFEGNHHSPKLQNFYNKYGVETLKFEILDYCEPIRKLLLAMEQKYLDDLKPEFNVCKIAGSSLGVKRTDEFKEKLRKANLGKVLSEEQKEKIRQGNLGKKQTPEAIEQSRKNRIGQKRNPTNFSRVEQYTLDGVFIKLHESIIQACRDTGIKDTHISNCCRGKIQKPKWFIWKYYIDNGE